MIKSKFFVTYLILLNILCACSKSDNVSKPDYVSLHNTWVLISYGNESNEVLKEAEGYYYIITFSPNGMYTGQAYFNDMWGEYNYSGYDIQISHPKMTAVYYEGSDPDSFFSEHLHDVYTYQISNNVLKLYYSKDQYFKFRIKDNK